MMQFLEDAGWQDAARTALAGDASLRRYWRLQRGDKTAILMQDDTGDIDLFARLAQHLLSLGLSAPRIFAQAHGWMLIEDLGDGLLARLSTDPETEKRLYLCATDALVALHEHAPPELPLASPERLAQMVDLAFDQYLARADAPNEAAKAAVITEMAKVLGSYANATDVMVLRDYHAENILWLPDRSGPARAGLLDFQDALQGHRAYDLISLVQDARRDLFDGTAEACLRHYVDQTGQRDAPFRTACAVLGVQRNLRILGVFARLAAERAKPRYLDLLPRVWGHLQTSLAHPELGKIANILSDALPPPDGDVIERLRQTCPTP